MKQLTHLRDGRKIGEYLLDLPDVVVGRGRAAHVRLDDNRMASRQHCVVRARPGTEDQHQVEDLGGANGTFVNGLRVEVHLLRPGDRIVFGEDTLRYDFASRQAASLRPPPPPSALEQQVFGGADAGGVEELDLGAVAELGDLSELRKVRAEQPRAAVPPPTGGGFAEHTAIAGRDELERLLAEAQAKARPHLEELGPEPRLHPLEASPARLGHHPDCELRLTGWKLLGRVAGEFVKQAGGWCFAPASPRWTPVRLRGERLTRIRLLSDGDELEVAGRVFRYRRGQGL